MKFCYKKVALILVLSFLTVNADHHTHEHNHQNHSDLLSAFDTHYHDYHHHHPIAQPNCGLICPKSLPKFQQFEVGHVYTVEVDGETFINVKEGQTVGLKGKLDVHVLSPCEFSLQLRDSRITGVPNPEELGQQLDSSPALRFGAFDGKVLGVCPAPEDPVWILNIKKAILSAMQMTTKDLTSTQTVEEVDFSGHCTTTYRPLSETDGKNVVLEKTKNLNKCHLRRKNISGFNTKSLTLLTEFLRENLPILKSTQKCLQEIKNGHLFSVSCTEEQRLSFQDESIVKSTLNLKFAAKAPAPGSPAGPATHKAQSLLMSRDDEGLQVAKESDVLALLKHMCTKVSGDKMSPEVGQLFHSLTTALKTLPESGTRTLDKAVRTGELCKSRKLKDLFIGASAFAASDASIKTIINAYNNKDLTATQASMLLTIVSLKVRPTEKTIEEFASIEDIKLNSRFLMIGSSLTIRNFCKRTENCETKPVVKTEISRFLEVLQTSDCNLERNAVIKSLDNLKIKTDESIKSALLEWAQKSDAGKGVRIAAIKALQRLADDSIRQKLIDILLKDNEPTEVRLSAYKAVVLSGASAQHLETIKSVNDFQIQNYIRSHIKNLKMSSNENRKNLLPKNAPEFEEPKSTGLGVTRNMVFSMKGLIFETDLIYTKGSLVPSLYTGTIWLPVTGKDIELLEVQLRQEGMDNRLRKLVSKGIGGAEILMQLSEEVLELLAHLKDDNHKHDLLLELSVRMSGKNVYFGEGFEDYHILAKMLKERLQELYKMDSIDIARAGSVLDSNVEVPTINGFPMLVHLNDSKVFGWKAERSTSETGGSKIRTIKSIPSWLDELSAGINLKVSNYRPGFEYHARAEVSHPIDGQVEKIDGRVMKARINVPKEKRSLIKITQNTHLIDGNGVPKESHEVSKRSTYEDYNYCRQLFGMDVCTKFTWPGNSPLPNVDHYVTRIDPTLEFVELTLEKPPTTATRDLMQWTAKVNAGKREYLAEFELKNPKEGIKKVNMKLVSPLRTITADTSLSTSADGNVSKMEMGLKLPNVIDINTKYNVERKGEFDKNVDVLSEYQLAGSDRKETLKWNRKTSFNYKKDKKTRVINVALNGELQSTQFPKYNSKFSYYTSLKPYQNSKTEVTLQWGPQLKDKIQVAHNSKMDVIELRPFQMVSENDLTVEITPMDINYNFKLNSDISTIKSKPKLINFNLVGKDVNGRPDRDIRGVLKYERTEQPNQQTINASLSYPGRDITYYSEVNQIKDLSFAGKMIYSPQKGKVITIEHKESITNPTKAFHLESEADVSYSWKEGKASVKSQIGWESADKFEAKYVYALNGQKQRQYDLNYDKKTGGVNAVVTCHEHQAELKVDNIHNPRSAQWGYKSGQKSYKFSAVRVPKESYSLKLDSAENSRLKEFKGKLSRKEKSTLKLVTNEGFDFDGYIDPFSKDKRAHCVVKSAKHGLEHTGDITLNRAERKITWESKTLKDGKPYITTESQFSPNKRSYLILKKIKGNDAVSKFEYFQDKGVYGAVLDTSRYSAILEGENRENKRFGKIGFVDKVDNYEHKSQFNVTNGVLSVKSISDKEKQTFTKFDATIGCKIVSEVTLITPKINGHLIINPLEEKKTLVLKYVSPKYDQNTNIEWVPHKFLKVDSLSQRKVDPQKRVKVDAYLTRHDEATVKVTAPALDIDIKRVKTPKPHFVFNTTINGYNEVQEYESNPSLSPTHNLLVALKKFLQDYFSTH